jgi:hypothetical protein
LSLRAAAREDRRFALLAAIDAATATDKGLPIGEAIINTFRDRGALLLSAERRDRIGRAGRAICAQARSSGDIEWADARINLTGIYSWWTEPTDPTTFRPLREEKSVCGQAA